MESQSSESELRLAKEKIKALEGLLEESQRQCEREQQKIRKFFETSPLAYQSLDKAGNIVEVNDSWTQMTGYSREETLGQNFSNFITSEWKEWFWENFPRLKASSEVMSDELEMHRKDGMPILVSCTGKVEKREDKCFKLAHFVFRDITNDRQIEKRLQAANDITQAANKAKSEFLANMSHEIRTPLNGIAGMLQLLEMTELDQEQKEYTQAAVKSANRLTQLLSDILDLSRVEAGKMELKLKPFNLKKTISNVCQLFELPAKQAGIELSCDVAPNISDHLVGDRLRIQQILDNLVGNSLKYTNSGQIRLSAYKQLADSVSPHRVLLVVSDTGIGIPDEKIKYLFQPFTQVSNGFTRRFEGAGLGLAICRQLVSMMGGNIAVDSESGKGTSVMVSLPMPQVDGSHSEGKMTPLSTTKAFITNVRALIVEDDDINSYAVRIMLEKEGIQAEVAANGLEALDALRQKNFDVILMDIQMPKMNGIEATQAIRAGEVGERKANIPIVAMTAYAMEGDRDVFLDAGMNCYIPKPVDKRAMLDAIAESVGNYEDV